MHEKVEGIIVSERDYGETSKILTVITKEYGLISMIAKGAKTMKSSLRSVTGKLCYGYFYIYYKKDKLSTLISVDVIDSLKHIKKDIGCISYASFLLELAEQVSKQTYHEEIYTLLKSSILKINEGFDPLVIMNILELKYLDYLGVMPKLDGCALCGSTKAIATLSASAGGYVCNHCLRNETMISEKAIKLIRLFWYVDISKISTLEVSEIAKREINTFLDDYYDRYTGLYLKSKTFLANLNKI